MSPSKVLLGVNWGNSALLTELPGELEWPANCGYNPFSPFTEGGVPSDVLLYLLEPELKSAGYSCFVSDPGVTMGLMCVIELVCRCSIARSFSRSRVSSSSGSE